MSLCSLAVESNTSFRHRLVSALNNITQQVNIHTNGRRYASLSILGYLFRLTFDKQINRTFGPTCSNHRLHVEVNNLEMNTNHVIWLMVATILLLVGQSLSSQPRADLANLSSSDRFRLRLPKLFCFSHYKDVFKKTYASIGEELVRRKLVLARAFRSFVSGVAYKHKQSKYYLALNRRSDRTPAELLALDSDIPPIPSKNSSSSLHKVDNVETDIPTLADEDEIHIELEKIKQLSELDKDSAFSTIAKELQNLDREQGSRQKRNVEHSSTRDDFTFDELIKIPEDRYKKRRAHRGSIPSNNPDYEAPEIMSRGSDQPEDSPMPETVVDELLLKSRRLADLNEGTATVESSSSWIRGWVGYFFTSAADTSSKKGPTNDTLLIDHRDCMTDIKDQGTCGSCYAFVATAYYEWLLCKQTGKLISLSEQYMVDCGPEGDLSRGLFGCNGGQVPYAGFFFESYGVELGINYPYMGLKGSCPYDDFKGSRKRTGFFRLSPESGTSTEIPYELFEAYLEVTPLVVAVGTGGSFHEYGGGIHNDRKCCRKSGDACGTHAVLIVGQGVQDGEEYWLMRNSFSTAYGEDGYYKMSKRADCIWPKAGFVFAFEGDGKAITLNAKRNSERPDIRSKIKDETRYSQGMLRWLLS